MIPTSSAATVDRHVLVIDDDRDFAEGLADILRLRGYSVTVAVDADHACDSLQSGHPQVALIDIRLGDSNGNDLIRDLRTLSPDILCIMVTAYPEIDTAIQALHEGADGYLRKPLCPDELTLTLNKSFQRLELEQEKLRAEQALQQAQEQLLQSQKMEAVGRLAGGVAHDFNNWLTIILGYCEVLRRQIGEGNDQLNAVEHIRVAAEKSAGLTRQLLAFSRKHVAQLRILNLNDIVREMDRPLLLLIGENIDVKMDLAPDLDTVKADTGLIEQTVMNLVINAADAMPKGGKVSIATANVVLGEADVREQIAPVDAGYFVRLTVRDTGIGIAPENISHIFEPFFTTKEVDKGTGLGLSTIYGIVTDIGGTIQVRSTAGLGSTFSVFLPVVHAILEDGDADANGSAPKTGTEAVLVVEDDNDLREMIFKTLREDGYIVHKCDCPQAALQFCRDYAGKLDFLLTDVIMPEMAGPELVEQVVALRPNIDVLFMSGYARDAIQDFRDDKAEFAFIQKPFTPVTLSTKIREVLDVGGR